MEVTKPRGPEQVAEPEAELEVVPGVFHTREQAEAAITQLRGELGLTEGDLGLVVPNPGVYEVAPEEGVEVAEGFGEGLAIGVPVGALAGMALMAIAAPGAGVIGLGGLLLIGGLGGGLWGAFLGGEAGIVARVRRSTRDMDECEIPVGSTEVLVMARPEKHLLQRTRDIMEEHGAVCFLREDHPAHSVPAT